MGFGLWNCVPGTLSYLAGHILGMALLTQVRLKRLHDALVNAQGEKEALESLLVMVCESVILIASDGDTIIRHDRRFEMWLRRCMEGATLSIRLPDQAFATCISAAPWKRRSAGSRDYPQDQATEVGREPNYDLCWHAHCCSSLARHAQCLLHVM